MIKVVIIIVLKSHLEINPGESLDQPGLTLFF
jgi:hypothetical protein